MSAVTDPRASRASRRINLVFVEISFSLDSIDNRFPADYYIRGFPFESAADSGSAASSACDYSCILDNLDSAAVTVHSAADSGSA